MAQNTALQDVIEKLNKDKDNFPPFGFDEEFMRGIYKGFQMAVFICQKTGLPKERTQIETAYNQGASDIDNLQDGNGRKFKNCMDYFTNTFNHQ